MWEAENVDSETESRNDTDKVVTTLQNESVGLTVAISKESMFGVTLKNLQKQADVTVHLIKKASNDLHLFRGMQGFNSVDYLLGDPVGTFAEECKS